MKKGICYSIKCSLIFLRCFLKATSEDIQFLKRFGIIPPEKMRKRDLAFWIDGAKAGYFAAPHQVFETVVKESEVKVWTVTSSPPTTHPAGPTALAGRCLPR